MNARTSLVGVLAALALALPAWSEEGGGGQGAAGRRRPAGPAVTGVVKSVDAAKKSITVAVEGQGEKTFTLGEQVTIMMRGPILDGIKPADKVEIRLRDEAGAQTVRSVTVSRDGVTPANWTGGWEAGRRGGGAQ